ncbi:hypothetical protein DACRYDRAFT_23755 [Dacryopinax primogenitus]|uniref:Phosphoesterase-domain-containing protein n=1 Tax=Dacryopinax primogenitus (strain DJM 731) TaxID=1858805 RepID=M5G1L4_DACPD|nr:uncharacterized protein DACRYDRAFT_23755 [Dacryopinax primogenitus]EJT99736.1 hypothetical protein DACRYDRAFT_23755 [Dacryopinax primogenitus]
MAAVVVLAAATAVLGATAPAFAPPGAGPQFQTANYTGFSNGTLQNGPVVPGLAFDRFIQIWFENTDFAVANSSAVFQQLATQGILLSNYVAVTHPSEPNYAAVVGGDFWGMGDDNLHYIPNNISTVADLLDAKNISWGEYQENQPYDGFPGYNYTQANYLNASAPPYTYYVRKHNPLILYDVVANVPSRASRIRNFNDFAVDLGNNTLPQWSFITPNMVNDAHDTTIDFAADFITYWLIPLISNPNFNTNRTLIVLTFDENETYGDVNNVWTLLFGGAVPQHLWGTVDNTFYSHYSCISSVEANWGLGNLGRGDVNKTMSNVFNFMITEYNVSYTNEDVTNPPLTNLTGNIPGPLNPQYWIPFTAPVNSTGAGGGPTLFLPGTNMNQMAANSPAPVNLTALGEALPGSTPATSAAAGGSSPSPSAGTSGAVELRMGAVSLLLALTGVAAFLL